MNSNLVQTTNTNACLEFASYLNKHNFLYLPTVKSAEVQQDGYYFRLEIHRNYEMLKAPDFMMRFQMLLENMHIAEFILALVSDILVCA